MNRALDNTTTLAAYSPVDFHLIWPCHLQANCLTDYNYRLSLMIALLYSYITTEIYRSRHAHLATEV